MNQVVHLSELVRDFSPSNIPSHGTYAPSPSNPVVVYVLPVISLKLSHGVFIAEYPGVVVLNNP